MAINSPDCLIYDSRYIMCRLTSRTICIQRRACDQPNVVYARNGLAETCYEH